MIEKLRKIRVPFETRFWLKVKKSDGCWIWEGGSDKKGYGRIQGRTKKIILAHRASYLIHYGELSDEICVLHRCDNPSCVRPDHLFLGTKFDNVRDMHEKGRFVSGAAKTRGEKNVNAKLTEEKVKEMRTKFSSGTNGSRLAKQYGMSPSQVYRILKGKSWAHF